MRLLVIRTSAMGDVALTTPVLIGMRQQYPDIELVLLTRPAFKSFFNNVNGVSLFFPDLKKRHKGLFGILRLYRDIVREKEIDCVIDLHDVLRSKILRFIFKLSGVPVWVIDKGRKEKRLVISGKEKVQLKHSVNRYCDVFEKAGFSVKPAEGICIVPSSDSLKVTDTMIENSGELNIGVAPYAKHKLKMWPEEYMIKLLVMISEKHKCRFWLFGGFEDSEKLASFQKQIPGSINLSGRLNLDEELALMSKLNFMIAMDSSNMHMAALTGTKVISIWGGTDPLSGFGAWMQPKEYFISIPVDQLTCRPCTTFGKGECKRGDFACMVWLTPEIVFERIRKAGILDKLSNFNTK
jgi:ADP-heptose:LPS heptosyltransferase